MYTYVQHAFTNMSHFQYICINAYAYKNKNKNKHKDTHTHTYSYTQNINTYKYGSEQISIITQ